MLDQPTDRYSARRVPAAMTRAASFALALVGMLTAASVSNATVFPSGFAGPSLEAGLIAAGTPGTSYSVGDGKLVLSQAPGFGDGQITVSAITPVTGDFVISITAYAGNLGRADLGIVLGNADWTYSLADIFINNLGHSVNGNIFLPIFNGAFLPNVADMMTLTITRTGNLISDIYDSGAGPVILNAGDDPSLSGPVTVSLFLLEAAGDTGAHQGVFGDFSVMSVSPGEIVPEPRTAGLLGFGMVALYGMTGTLRRNRAVARRA